MKTKVLIGIFVISAMALLSGCVAPQTQKVPAPKAHAPQHYAPNRSHSGMQSGVHRNDASPNKMWYEFDGERHWVKVLKRDEFGNPSYFEISEDCPCEKCKQLREHPTRSVSPKEGMPLPSQMPAVPRADDDQFYLDSSSR